MHGKRLERRIVVVLGLALLVPSTWCQGRTSSVDGEAARARVPYVFEGLVLGTEGAPAEGALVVSSAGGKAVVGANGHYRLEVAVPLEAERLRVTAVGSIQNEVASTSVELSGSAGGWLSPLHLSRGGGCSPDWIPTFGIQPGVGGYGSLGGLVHAVLSFDDGSGPALYVVGYFAEVGGVASDSVARWDGHQWSAMPGILPNAFNNEVYAIAVYDDGLGPRLYIGGEFTTLSGSPGVAYWNGLTWVGLGAGVNDVVYSMAAYDDGSGEKLYVSGRFTSAGGMPAPWAATWNGIQWSAFGSFDEAGYSMTVHDDGSGEALFIGGNFSSRLVRYDGAMMALGSGFDGPVFSLAFFDDGSGEALYVGGLFTTTGAVPVNNIVRWDGTSWSALGAGADNLVWSLEVFDDGGGPALYAGGYFEMAGGAPAAGIARWDGSSWTTLGSGIQYEVFAMEVFDDGSGPVLYAGGRMAQAEDFGVGALARWDGVAWDALGSGLEDNVAAIEAFDDGSGMALYVGGKFIGPNTPNVTRWDGAAWGPVGGGLDFQVNSFQAFDDGSGTALYAGGGSSPVGSYLERWDGSTWSVFGGGVSGAVYDMIVFDDGGGPALFVGGNLTMAGGLPVGRIARWDGSSWSDLAGGMDTAVYDLEVYDDGTGPALYAGGYFIMAGGGSANRVARWNGTTWSSLGTGLDGRCWDLAVFDDGGGADLYAGGHFFTAGGVSVARIARWDGLAWSRVGTGNFNGEIRALETFDAGGGPALFAGGDFDVAGGVAADHVARWDGSTWGPLGAGVEDSVLVLESLDEGSGPLLYLGGAFDLAASGDSHIARWGCGDLQAPLVLCPDDLVVIDRIGTPPGEVVAFSVSATDDQDPSPEVVCVPPSGSLFPQGTTVVTCTATDDSGNQSVCEFLVTVSLKARRQ